MAGGFLINRNCWGKPFDRIHIRLIHLAQKLTGIGGKALHIAPLALGKDRVKGQGTLAAAAYPGENHQAIAGQGDVNVAQVVLAGPPHPDHLPQAAAGECLQGLPGSGFSAGH